LRYSLRRENCRIAALYPGRCYENVSNGNHSKFTGILVLIQRKEYGGGEIWFDGKLIRKDGIFVHPALKCLNPSELLGK
jgi:aminopeptidase